MNFDDQLREELFGCRPHNGVMGDQAIEQYIDLPEGGVKHEDLDEYLNPEWRDREWKRVCEQKVIDQMAFGLAVTHLDQKTLPSAVATVAALTSAEAWPDETPVGRKPCSASTWKARGRFWTGRIRR